jgi:arylsulfatase A-like enzyme
VFLVANWWRHHGYMYNCKKQCPYTPSVRALRTDDWTYVRYPNLPAPQMAELYDVADDSDELVNLINEPRYRARTANMDVELNRQLIASSTWPDTVPLHEGIGQPLPAASIRQ